MGAESSVQRDGKSQEAEDASAATATAAGEEEMKEVQGDESKSLQKNGQISSMSSLNGHSEGDTLDEVGQPDGVSVAQKEEAPETMDTIQDEVAPQVNGEKVEKESSDANDISPVEEKAAEEKPGDANEVGFKKIFRFVGFKFTLKKDKSEEKDPVKLLTIKDKDGDAVVDEAVKEEEVATEEEKSPVEEKKADTAAEDAEKTEISEVKAEPAEGEAGEDAPKEEKTEKEEETTQPQEVISPFRKIFSGGLFSNLRKKASIKKTKEEEEVKEETPKAEETEVAAEEVKAETKEEAQEDEAKKEAAPSSEEDKSKEEATTEEVKEPAPEEPTPEAAKEGEATAEASAPETDTTDEPKQDEEKAALEVSSEAEMLSSQEKAKPHGSPLKKLFTGAGLKKLSTKKQKAKKDAEPKQPESGEQAEQLQSSTESAEAPKAESGPSSPEESGEQVIAVEVTEKESSQEAEGEVTSDGEKKKEGIIAWSSFKKLVTPKRRVKRPSESDDEATAEKPAKSATLSSTESATLADKTGEEETKEEATEEEPKTEATEKLTSSTEEKKKMDTSVSWEALMCMGGPKKRTRKTSDSDDDETKVEEEPPVTASAESEEEAKVDAAVVTSQTSENEGEIVSSPEPMSPPASAWDTLKRMVTLKRSKSEEKPEEGAEQVLSDSEAPKEESSFFLKKFFPGRRKKKSDKPSSAESTGEEDSDTPAVVPLSEYDEPAEPELEKSEEPEEPVAVQTKVDAEERSPSWISAAVEEDKQDQLSDIPEEAESAATPKSVDTDIAEDEDQAVSPKPYSRGRRLSTAEVKPLAPATSSETAALPKGPEKNSAEEVIQGIEAQNTEIPAETSVTVENVPVEVATETTEYEPQTETADTKTNAILEVHARDEAMAICTGLGTKEIAKVTLEKPVSPITESMAVIRDACATELSLEERPGQTEQATASEDPVLEAQIHQVDTTELAPLVEKTPNSIADIQVATESIEPQVVKVGIVSTELEGSEVVQPPTVDENSPKAVVIDSINATSEAVVCIQSVEVSEPTLETKEVQMDMEQLVATEENTPVQEVVQVVTKEITSATCNSAMTTTEESEPEIPVVLPSEVVPVIAETVILVAPVNTESEEALTTEPTADENVAVTETSADETAESEISAAVEEVTEKDPELEIESQSMEIAKNVIQGAMDKVAEDAPEPEKPSSPAPSVPVQDQAIATVEKDVEIESETPVITETPVPVVCEKSAPKALHVATEVIDEIPIEVTGCIDGSEEDVKDEEESKKDEEDKVSEEAATEEVKEENQNDEPEQSNEDAVTEEKVNDVETTEEETDSKPTLQIHIPVQVVLQTAQVLEDPTVEEEAAVEFDSNGPVDAPVQEEVKTNGETTEEQVSERLSTLTEEPQEAEGAAADSQPEEEKPSGKCAEVMAQVIEVIEEAVKEIEPVSTEITAAS